MNPEQDTIGVFEQLGILPGKSVLLCGRWTGSIASLHRLFDTLIERIGTAETLVVSGQGENSSELWEALALSEGVLRSTHPIFPFAAIGANAGYITVNAPLHFPLGTNSPIAKLHQLDGHMIILGAEFAGNPAIHLAEVWADVPYAGLSSIVADREGNTMEIHGCPGCGWGFGKIEKVLRQARILKERTISGVACQSMSIRQVASMAGEMLKGDPGCLLCDRPGCAFCNHARTLTRKQGEPAGKRWIDFNEIG